MNQITAMPNRKPLNLTNRISTQCNIDSDWGRKLITATATASAPLIVRSPIGPHVIARFIIGAAKVLESRYECSPNYESNLKRIEEIALMRFEECEVPNRVAKFNAIAVIDRLHSRSLSPEHVDPCADGGFTISFKKGEKYLAIECYNTGETALVEYGRGVETNVIMFANECYGELVERIYDQVV